MSDATTRIPVEIDDIGKLTRPGFWIEGEEEKRLQPYSVFVLDVNGIATVAFAAQKWADAQIMRSELWLRDELSAQTSKGAPIWDGASKLRVREANKNEIERFAQSASGFLPEDVPLVYLVELDHQASKSTTILPEEVGAIRRLVELGLKAGKK